MTDLSTTIAPKSDQFNADDLINGPATIKITKVSKADTPDQPIAIFFDGDNGKPYKPCKSMRRVLVQIWGKDGAKYVGRSMTIYRDDGVTFGGLAVGGIRISHMSDIKEKRTLALTASKANRKPFTVQPLTVAKAAAPVTPVIVPDEFLASAKAEAANGTEAFRKWWVSIDKTKQDTLVAHTNSLQEIAAAADEKKKTTPTKETEAEYSFDNEE